MFPQGIRKISKNGSQNSVVGGNNPESSGGLDEINQRLKDVSINESLYLKDKEIIKTDFYDYEIPNNVITSSVNFLKSFVREEELKQNIQFKEGALLRDINSNSESYVLTYLLIVESYRQNGKKMISGYSLKINVDLEGNILDDLTPKEKYATIKERGI